MENDSPVPVWLDCDPGHDDAMAICLAGHHPTLRLLGISTVAGNQSLSKVTQNALDMLDAAGLQHIDVVAGQAKPLMRPGLICAEIHGDSGLDGPSGGPLLPRSRRQPIAGPAAVVMARALVSALEESGRAVLICTGCLTNAALLLTLYPDLVPRLEVVIMGGCRGVGNTGCVTEFNIQVDPEAAKIVFESGVSLTMVPLEVTHTVLVTGDVLRRVRGAQGSVSPFSAAVEALLLFFAATYKSVFGFDDPPLHDPVAVAYVVNPSLFKTRHMRVDIEVGSQLSAGQTVHDVWGQTGRAKNCVVAESVDVSAFWDLLLDALARAGAVSPLNK